MLWCSQVKIARALSVGEGKGVVRWVARVEREETVWRGNLMAWVSGWVKSRHLRQEGVVDGAEGGVEGNFGLVDSNFERSGREESGIGGGVVADREPLVIVLGCSVS